MPIHLGYNFLNGRFLMLRILVWFNRDGNRAIIKRYMVVIFAVGGGGNCVGSEKMGAYLFKSVGRWWSWRFGQGVLRVKK